MKFGIHWTAQLTEAGKIRKAAVLAEKLGYYSFGLPDHLVTEGKPSQTLVDPFLGLSAAAENTTKIKLATMVLISGLRRPVQLAREVASAQVLSDGRMEIGLGGGWIPYEKTLFDRWVGDSPTKRLKDSLEMLRCAFDGTAHSPTQSCSDPDHSLARSMVGAAPTPTFMGAAGGPKMLNIAAQLSDVVMLTVPTARRLEGEEPSEELLSQQIAIVKKGESHNHKVSDIQFQIREYAPGVGQQSKNLWLLRGSDSEIIQRLKKLQDMGITYISFCTNDTNEMEKFADGIFGKI